MNKKTILLIVAALVLAVASFWLGQSMSGGGGAVSRGAPIDSTKQVWTCSMHPQIRLDQAGNCPICEMPLIPADASSRSGAGETPLLNLSEQAMAMAHVETTPVSRRALARSLRAVGKIQYNESSLATVTARVDGYAERLYVNVTGVEIRAGDHLAEIYSPEIAVAQQELFSALRSNTTEGNTMVEASKLKLRRWGLTDDQIKGLVATQKATDRITLHSPIQGTVIEKSIVQDSAFKAGDVLYRIANLDTVWVYLEIYEVDFSTVRYGQLAEFTAEAWPGRTFTGRVTFVQPLVNEETRTIRVPVVVDNADHALKPGMFVSAVIHATLGADGQAAPTGAEGKYSCPMHPQVLQDQSGACPSCQMPLERIALPAAPPTTVQAPGAGEAPAGSASLQYQCTMKCEGEKTYAEPGRCPVCNMKLTALAPPAPAPAVAANSHPLAVPATAVLDSGKRRLAYVEKLRGHFEPREVVLGPRAGEFFPVLRGLVEGERVVTRGGFLIDSQFQISGESSLFYPGGMMAPSGGHDHGQLAPPSSSSSAPAAPVATPTTPPANHGGH